jgi:hypothetical protein
MPLVVSGARKCSQHALQPIETSASVGVMDALLCKFLPVLLLTLLLLLLLNLTGFRTHPRYPAPYPPMANSTTAMLPGCPQ